MGKAKKPFRESTLYPIFFMIIITIVFIGILATFYQATYPKVQKHEQLSLKKMILKSFDLPTNNIEDTFNLYITEKKVNDLVFYQARKDSVLGNCFLISGSGLWGTVNALLAVSSDFEKIIGFEILSQNETPGLGGRITEKWFTSQFKDKRLFGNGKIIKFTLVSEENKIANNQIKQITGATSSSKAVINMIYREFEKIKAEFSHE